MNEDYPKFRNLTNQKEIENIMNYIVVVLNIKVSNDEERKNLDLQIPIIYDFIKTKFGSLTAQEIKEAFKMYAAKEFENVKPFRILDCICIGEVLSAFESYRADALRTYTSKKNKQHFLLEQEKNKPNAEELEKIHLKFLNQIFDDLIKKQHSDDLWLLWENDDKTLSKLAVNTNKTITDIEKKIMYKQQEDIYISSMKKNYNNKHTIKQILEKITNNQPLYEVTKICRNITASRYLLQFLDNFDSFKNAIK